MIEWTCRVVGVCGRGLALLQRNGEQNEEGELIFFYVTLVSSIANG